MTLTIQDIGGGGSRFEGFETIIHLGAGTVLLTGVALSIASVVAFVTSSAMDRQGTCDHWTLRAGHLLIYLALAPTVSGFTSLLVIGEGSLGSPDNEGLYK
jgi:hypothetical protein